MSHFKWIPVLVLAALAACAPQAARQSPERASSRTIDYGEYVQGTVPWFNFTSLYSWDSDQLGYVVVWTTPRQAYRLQLVGPCLGLQTAAGVIGLTSQDGLVSSNRDAVIAGGEHCRIMRIDRLDAKAIRAARTQPKASAKASD
jgi:hypothetical protein